MRDGHPVPGVTVGIVVPIFDTGQMLQATLDSIRAQTYADWTAVLVDDGSTDEPTVEFCDKYVSLDRRFTVVHQLNCGISAARNAGFARLSESTQFVTFMDHDDVWLPEALEILVAAADAHEGIGAHAIAETIDSEGKLLPGFASYMRSRVRPGDRCLANMAPDEATSLESTLFVNRAYPPGVLLIQRTAYEKAGLWDSRWKAVQDWDMLLRLLQYGSIAYVDRVVLHYRRHAGNESGDAARNIAETRALHVESFSRLEPTHGRATLRRWWRQWERMKLQEAAGRLPSPAAGAALAAHGWRWARGWPSTGRLG